jgi:membrane protein required for colicin V production
LNLLDAGIALILLVSVVTAARAGFSREVIGLAAVVLAAICGIWFYGTAGAFLLPYVSSPQVAHFAGFALVFLSIMLLGAIAAHIVSRLLKTVGLTWLDRILGAMFGAVRGILICVVLVMVLVAFSPGPAGAGAPHSVVGSRFAPYVIGTARVIVSIAPHEMKDGFRAHYDQVRQAWDHAVEKPAVEKPRRDGAL